MVPKIFHIFRNTPLGRETLLQSLFFCKTVGSSLVIYIPKYTKFLMYFENDVVQVDLDGSYLTAPETALEHAEALAQEAGIKPVFLEPKNYTASTLPDISTNFDYMCCPRSISDLSSKIGLGYIGPRVRRIVQSAKFPVLVTSPAFKQWNRVAVLFGGSANAVNAFRLGIRISRETGFPMDMVTQVERRTPEFYEKIIREQGLDADRERYVENWRFFETGKFEENLYEIPHDALVILGAYGHGLIRDIMFGIKMEKVQSTITNNLLIAGPNYSARA